MESLEERGRKDCWEDIEIAPDSSCWPDRFQVEREHLLTCLPAELIGRIEHFGSTAVPRLAAKPIIDMLVEVTCLEETRKRMVPILESQGYEYFWRPTPGDDQPLFYAWFIKRNVRGVRSHHVHNGGKPLRALEPVAVPGLSHRAS